MAKNNKTYIQQSGYVFTTWRGTSFSFLLYPFEDNDNNSHALILARLIEYCEQNNIKYYHITHDKDPIEDDIDNTGVQFKKAHMHIYISVKPTSKIRYTWAHILADKIGMFDDNLRFIRVGSDLNIRYLIHYDNADKYHYNIKDICTNDPDIEQFFERLPLYKRPKANKTLNGEVGLLEILTVIDNLEIQYPVGVSYRILLKECLNRGLYSRFIAHQGIIKNYLESR